MRISVTDLDGWRYYKATEEMDVEGFLKRLRKEEPPTQNMLAGKALHKVLQHAGAGDLTTAEADGFRFKFLVDCDIPLLPVRELKGEIVIQTAAGPVTLVGIIDGHDGSVYDHKLTGRFDAERYADSYQWRAYLTMFGARRFVYQVFEGKEGDDLTEWLVYGFHRFPLYAYEGMRGDVEREVGELASFIAEHMPERAQRIAA